MVTDNHVLQYGNESEWVTTFRTFRDFKERIQRKNFSVESSNECVMLLIETMLEDFKPVPSRQNEFENRDRSKVKAFFGLFAPSGFCYKIRNNKTEASSLTSNFLILIPMEKRQTCTQAEIRV